MSETQIDIVHHKIEKHATEYSQYTRQIIYGGLDGIITTFSIISASVGANLDYKIVVTMGIANLFADAISMGFGEYISTSMETNLVNKERERESIEFDKNLIEEKKELINILTNKNMDIDDASTIVNVYSKSQYKELFLDYMMFLEHNMLQSEETTQLIKNGFVTFIAFILFGSIPLIVFIITCTIDISLYHQAFWISTIVAVITMYFLGFFQAIIAAQNPVRNGFIVMGNGILATSCAYGIGYIFENFI